MFDIHTDEEAFEREALRKAEEDIAAGELRLSRQEQLVAQLDKDGHDTTQARQLVNLLRHTLEEWRKHRILIEDRLVYLARKH